MYGESTTPYDQWNVYVQHVRCTRRSLHITKKKNEGAAQSDFPHFICQYCSKKQQNCDGSCVSRDTCGVQKCEALAVVG